VPRAKRKTHHAVAREALGGTAGQHRSLFDLGNEIAWLSLSRHEYEKLEPASARV
jgi:hypothetical protein